VLVIITGAYELPSVLTPMAQTQVGNLLSQQRHLLPNPISFHFNNISTFTSLKEIPCDGGFGGNKQFKIIQWTTFDLEAHVLNPNSYENSMDATQMLSELECGTADLLINDTCRKLAEYLQEKIRLAHLAHYYQDILSTRPLLARMMLNLKPCGSQPLKPARRQKPIPN
jgi:hypothetical protein